MAAALRPGLRSPARARAIDEWVPTAVRVDVERMVSNFEAQGAIVYGIQIPADDFGYVVAQASKGAFVQFSPTLLGIPIMPWAQSHIGVMARKQEVDQPLLVDNRGRSLDVAQEG